MSNAIEQVSKTDQIRFQERLILGRDTLAETYNVVDTNVDGKLAVRGYVWDTGTLSWVAQAVSTDIPVNYDEIVMTYNGDNNITSAIYKLLGTTVSTITLTYTGTNLTRLQRS